MSTRIKPPRVTLVPHRTVAEWFGVDSRTLSRWVRTGYFPIEHSTQGRFLMYDRSVIEHRLNTGLWPASVRFHGEGYRA
jgi:hypothetical protein